MITPGNLLAGFMVKCINRLKLKGMMSLKSEADINQECKEKEAADQPGKALGSHSRSVCDRGH